MQYRLGKELGRGSYGIVYEDLEYPTQRVIKVLQPESKQQFRNIFKEAVFGKKFSHPNLFPILDVEYDPLHNRVYLNILRGIPLSDLPRSNQKNIRRLLLRLHDQVCGLHALHSKGWLHLDVKPDNMLASEEGARLADFGMVAPEGVQPEVYGTPLFLQPRPPPLPHQQQDLYALLLSLQEQVLQDANVPFTWKEEKEGWRLLFRPSSLSAEYLQLFAQLQTWLNELEVHPTRVTTRDLLNYFGTECAVPEEANSLRRARQNVKSGNTLDSWESRLPAYFVENQDPYIRNIARRLV